MDLCIWNSFFLIVNSFYEVKLFKLFLAKPKLQFRSYRTVTEVTLKLTEFVLHFLNGTVYRPSYATACIQFLPPLGLRKYVCNVSLCKLREWTLDLFWWIRYQTFRFHRYITLFQFCIVTSSNYVTPLRTVVPLSDTYIPHMRSSNITIY